MMVIVRPRRLALLLLFFLPLCAPGQEPFYFDPEVQRSFLPSDPHPEPAPAPHLQRTHNPFHEGPWSLEILGGYCASSSLGPDGPTFRYATITGRAGYDFATLWDGSLFRGNWQLLAEIQGAPGIEGSADLILGGSLLLRYNFQQPSAKLVPYVQFGGGLVYSDAHTDRNQDTLGAPVEFLLQAQLGCRYRLSDCWSFTIEAGYQHISNAGTARRNAGLNAFGGQFGFVYHFGAPRD